MREALPPRLSPKVLAMSSAYGWWQRILWGREHGPEFVAQGQYEDARKAWMEER